MKKIIGAVVLLTPGVAFALQDITDVDSLSTRLLSIGNIISYILVSAAVLFIVYNVVWYLVKGKDSAEKGTAGLNILYGISGLFVIVSIWGIVNILTNTFKTTTGNQPIPNFGNDIGQGGIPANQIPQAR